MFTPVTGEVAVTSQSTPLASSVCCSCHVVSWLPSVKITWTSTPDFAAVTSALVSDFDAVDLMFA